MHRVHRSTLRRRVAMAVGALVCAVAALLSGVDAALASAGVEEDVSDPERTRVVTITVVAMIVAGVIVLAVTVWFWRSTRPEPPVLAPLEVMGERRFVRADHDEQQRRLDRVRPPGAEAEALPAPSLASPAPGDPPSPADEVVPAEEVATAEAAAGGPEGTEDLADELAPAEAAAAEPDGPGDPADEAEAAVEHDHTPEGDERPSADGDEAGPPAIDPLLGRFQ